MSILHKQLSQSELATLDLFLHGALAPLSGYLSQQDHISVLKHSRLANDYLWPLAFTLRLTTDEKLQAQRSGRIALTDEEQRVLAEVETSELYRLPTELTSQEEQPNRFWYASGTIKPVTKVLHPTFNSLRHNTRAIQHKFKDSQQILAVHTDGELNPKDLQHAYLTASHNLNSQILLQVNAATSPVLHEQMRVVRQAIRQNARQHSNVRLSLLPEIPALSPERQLLLQARIAKNFGATGFLLSTSTPKNLQRTLIRLSDELGLEMIPAKRSATGRAPRYQANELKLAA